jgi:hypothetical protein
MSFYCAYRLQTRKPFTCTVLEGTQLCSKAWQLPSNSIELQCATTAKGQIGKPHSQRCWLALHQQHAAMTWLEFRAWGTWIHSTKVVSKRHTKGPSNQSGNSEPISPEEFELNTEALMRGH